MPTRYCARSLLCSALALLLVACSNGRGSLSEPAAPPPAAGASANFSIGGVVNGLAGSGLVLQNDDEDLPITASGPFTFATTAPAGTAYEVTVLTQPGNPVQECSVANGAGTISANVTNIAVTCSTDQVSIGGTVSGLSGSGLVLQLNGAADLTLSSNGTFSFATTLSAGATYAVTVRTQPTNPAQVCTIANGSGTTSSANVTNIRVTCAANTFAVGGSVNGLLGSGLVLRNNGGDDLAVGANGSFIFNTRLASGSAYQVTVRTQPSNPTQACTVNNGQGTVGSAAVANIVVSCNTSDFTIGGTVRDLVGSGLVLRNNATDDLTIDANGGFTFATALPMGAPYNVTVATQPRDPDQSCTVERGSGVVGAGNVSSIVVRCASIGFTIGGRIRGLRGSGLVLQNNGSDNLAIASGGRFIFSTPVSSGAPYNVTVASQPSNPRQNCTIDHGSGTVRDRNIDNVDVRCRGDD